MTWSEPGLFDAFPDHPVGTVVVIEATTGASIGVKGSDGRWRRMQAVPGNGASDEHTLPHARVLYTPQSGGSR